MKDLILYFSRAGENYFNGDIRSIDKGNTEIVAEYIGEATGGDLFKVEPVKPYSDEYFACVEESKIEKAENARPELKHMLDNIDEYDNIFICGPCWLGTYPMPLFTQLENLDFTGKNVYPVITHEGSGFGNSQRDLEKAVTGAKIHKGLAVHGADTQKQEKQIKDWAKKVVKS